MPGTNKQKQLFVNKLSETEQLFRNDTHQKQLRPLGTTTRIQRRIPHRMLGGPPKTRFPQAGAIRPTKAGSMLAGEDRSLAEGSEEECRTAVPPAQELSSERPGRCPRIRTPPFETKPTIPKAIPRVPMLEIRSTFPLLRKKAQTRTQNQALDVGEKRRQSHLMMTTVPMTLSHHLASLQKRRQKRGRHGPDPRVLLHESSSRKQIKVKDVQQLQTVHHHQNIMTW